MEKETLTATEWLSGNWGWVAAVFCTLFEIAPIKIHPITWVLGWIGKKLTGDIRDDIKALRKDVDMQRMASIRTLVLDFSNSCLRGQKHTKEEFDHVLAENRVYDALVKEYEVENEVYCEAYDYIKRIYRKRMDRRDFLTAPPPDPEDD